MTASLPRRAERQNLHEEFLALCSHCRDYKTPPFGSGDTTAGMEYELQVAVAGSSSHVDLPLAIKTSGYFRNIIKRNERGDCPDRIVRDLKELLEDHNRTVWENSWIRMKTGCLCNRAARLVEHDFLADKTQPNGPLRGDRQRFFTIHREEQWLRLPISYLLKLALADHLGRQQELPPSIAQRATRWLDHFISDNTSPEILSLQVVHNDTSTIGTSAARETARTYLLCQLLVAYANSRFELQRNGQRVILYFSPQAPLSQKAINDLVPDSFYRYLYMSPCLSGWDRGEEKHTYMELCHRTLSRSQLNAIGKLREAGILSNNLVVLPNTSNTCLANNGTHVSLGSTMLSAWAADQRCHFTPSIEKYAGDLVIKIVEHFLPLFVTTCSAAPYRVDYAAFHPEKVLGFLPHELDYTHLRMLWRRWKKKADIRVFGQPLTPFGPLWLDRVIALLAGVNGDYIPDFRLIDYLVALLSSETNSALDGFLGNDQLLKRDLAEMGVFDERMALYLPYRLRSFREKGFSGFEGRFYSLFPSLLDDMRLAVDLQNLVTALAYRYILNGTISHQDIPDTPNSESERRQIFFAAAIGIPTVFIKSGTYNRFLARILDCVEGRRQSRRYHGYTRISVHHYQLALLHLITKDCPDLIEQLQVGTSLYDLKQRVANQACSAGGRLCNAVLASLGRYQSPLKVPADTFNRGTEEYYREPLRRNHLEEGLLVIAEDCLIFEQQNADLAAHLAEKIDIAESLTNYLQRRRQDILEETLSPEALSAFLSIVLTIIAAMEESRPA